MAAHYNKLSSEFLSMKLFLLLWLAKLSFSSVYQPVRFDDFKVYRITPTTAAQVRTLQKLEQTQQGYDFWSGATGVGNTVDIMVPPHLNYNFLDFVDFHNLNAVVWIDNVQQNIDNEKKTALAASAQPDWMSYQTLDQIYAWMVSLAQDYFGNVTSIVAGRSYEGREIRGVKVSFGPGRKGVFIEGGIHAREWISPATVTYILNQLLISNNEQVETLAASYDWYIFPVKNPDGYVYSHTTNRMWRKTRKPFPLCYGVDPNRNWDYYWMNGGASIIPCLEDFAGFQSFSEPETRSLSQYINGIANNLVAYLSFHSYGQLLLIPFGHNHNGGEVPENNAELFRIGNATVESLAERYGTQYTVGNVRQVLYDASGTSIDWVKGRYRNIRLVYAYELRDKGNTGFTLPADQIIPTGEETLDSLIRMFYEANLP